MNLTSLYNTFLNHLVICTDTRKIIPGCIFFALKGNNFNGNEFALNALNSGAALAVVDEKINNANTDKIFFTDDVLTTLQQLANYHRKQLKIPVIALTGSNGKTTTKELIHSVLKEKYNVLATTGNLNNHIGVPLSLLSLKKEHEVAVIEMGANHQKEIELLCSIAEPDEGLITNIGKAHLEGFGGEGGVLKGKGELYDFLRMNNGKIYINTDQPKLKTILKGYNKTVGYGKDDEARYQGNVVEGDEWLILNITHPFSLQIKTQLAGDYNFDNVLAAVAVGSEWKIVPEKIKQGIEKFIPSNQRSQIIKKNNITIVLDAYNANPTSMEAALKNFARTFKGKKIAALGDMLELGNESEHEHFIIGQRLQELKLDDIILVGENFKPVAVKFNLKHFNSADEAAQWFSSKKNDTFNLLVKGSRGIQMEKIVNEL